MGGASSGARYAQDKIFPTPSQKGGWMSESTKDVRRASFVNLTPAKKLSFKSEEVSNLHAVDALKGTIFNDASRRAFLKFLIRQGSGHDTILNYYFEIEELKATKPDEILNKAHVIYNRYKTILQGTLLPELKTSLQGALEITVPPAMGGENTADTAAKIIIQCNEAQAYLVTIFGSILSDFYKSDIYVEFENAKNDQEGALFANKAATGLLSSAPSTTALSPGTPVGNGMGHSMHISQPSVRRVSDPLPPGIKASTFPERYQSVLVVDDSSVSAKLAMMALKRNGHASIKIANNGRRCVEMCAEEKFDLVLIDLYMPIMDGFETLKALKDSKFAASSKNPEASFPVIIGMSADWDEQTEAKALGCGADMFMDKPVTVEKLGSVLVKFQLKGRREP